MADAGRIVKRATYERDYHALTKRMVRRLFRMRFGRILFFAGFIILAVAACALYFGPFGPTGQPDPTIIQTAPSQITSSFGSTLCFLCFLRRWRPHFFSSSRLWRSWH